MKNNIVEQGRERAIDVISHCEKSIGFYASGLPGGYEALWARDSMITALGASFVDKTFKKVFAQSLQTLAEDQSEHGQIPNAVGTYNTDRRSYVTFNTIDSSLWYIIGHHVYAKAYRDKSLLKKYQKSLAEALRWVQYQDTNEDLLPAQLPTMDWQDAFPHKYGHTINTQALYYWALRLAGERKLAKQLQSIVNGKVQKYLALYDEKRGYYLPWVWKNHDGDREQEEWFDTLGNMLAVVSGLATLKIAKSILLHVEKDKINKPFPCKVISPPIRPGDKEWHSYFAKSDAGEPYSYSNAGVWPFAGGFYVAALVKAKQYEKAEKELRNLAKANKLAGRLKEWEFSEWIHGKTGEAEGEPYQGWSAGTYLFATESVKRKKVPYT